MAYTTQIFTEVGYGLTMAAKNDVLGLLVFSLFVVIGAFLFVKHEDQKRFEASLRKNKKEA